jgi:diaminopimelate decarboxylase/aspartate kinase
MNNKTLNDIILKTTELACSLNVNIDDIIDNFQTQCLNAKTLDDEINIVSKGEFFTCHILNRYLCQNKIKSQFVSSLDIICCSLENTSMYNKGEFVVNPVKIINSLQIFNVTVVPGFSASTPSNKCCLLGRGGSDTTGSIIASAINASVYEIWTDVNGIFSSDPRKISNTFINPSINYDAAQEVAAMGAKVIHPYCILPCAIKNIPICIFNTFDPHAQSTVICATNNNNIYGVTMQDNVKLFKISSLNMWNNYGFVYDIFSVFKEFNVDVNIINTSQFNITTTTDETDEIKLYAIKKKLEEKYQVDLKFANSIVSIVGDNIRTIDKIGIIFKLVKNFEIITTSYSSNDMSLSFVVDSSIAINLTQQLHDTVFIV